MITIKQLQRLWASGNYDAISRLCLEMRPESSTRLIMLLGESIPAAALMVIRMDELGQSYHPFASQLIRALLKSQETDGGWHDPLTSALALKALLASRGRGLAIERAIAYLASLQKDDGLWPKDPLRRMPADPYISAMILFLLADDPGFTSAIRSKDALTALQANADDCQVAALLKSIRARHAW